MENPFADHVFFSNLVNHKKCAQERQNVRNCISKAYMIEGECDYMYSLFRKCLDKIDK